jgi:hypothetical protein
LIFIEYCKNAGQASAIGRQSCFLCSFLLQQQKKGGVLGKQKKEGETFRKFAHQ